MGMKKPLATVAVARGRLALLVFRDAAADGEISGAELPAIRDALIDWMSASRATHAAKALGHAIECGVGALDERYLLGLVDEYRQTIDELPPAA